MAEARVGVFETPALASFSELSCSAVWSLGVDILTGKLSFAVVQIEEFETPQPHYRVQLTSRIADVPATAGLIPDEIIAVVHLPFTIGTDLEVIKRAAMDQMLTNIRRLTSTH